MKKTHILLALSLIVLISACDTLPLPFSGKESGPQEPILIEQWAIEARASSAYGGLLGQNRDDQSPYAATGEPDVEECGDSKNAWTTKKEDDGLHYIELIYWDRVYVSGIKIHETYNPGFVRKIELKNRTGGYFTFWEGTYDPRRECPYIFEAGFEYLDDMNITRKITPFSTDTIKITIDTNVKGWNEIDAVQLLGYMDNWYWFNNSIVYEKRD
jgi:hypothetical protein